MINYYTLHRAYHQYKFAHVTPIRTLDPRGLLNLSSLHGSSTAFPVATRHTSPPKDMESTVANNTRRLVDTQRRIYYVEGAFLSVVVNRRYSLCALEGYSPFGRVVHARL